MKRVPTENFELFIGISLRKRKRVSEEAGQRKRPVRKPRAIDEAVFAEKKSYWPFVLALALAIALMGVVIHPILLVIGLLLVVVAVIGWGLERPSSTK
jgi:hypothetical protein